MCSKEPWLGCTMVHESCTAPPSLATWSYVSIVAFHAVTRAYAPPVPDRRQNPPEIGQVGLITEQSGNVFRVGIFS